MTAMWALSRTKEYDLRGDPIIGARAYFYDTGTTTPQTVYSEASLSLAYTSENPVKTDGHGRWPAVYLSPTPGKYRVRVVDREGAVLFDDDAISVPLEATYTPPDAGTTSPTLLYQTGDLKPRYDTGTLSGYVRCNGRTIGSATSGATERANADCQALFQHLWNRDPNLAVSGGRGANASADWSAAKTIALPDWRDRALVGLGDMGAADADRIPDSIVDGGKTNTTLGATVGASRVKLAVEDIPAHSHTGTTSLDGGHVHTVGPLQRRHGMNGDGSSHWSDGDTGGGSVSKTSNSAGDHTHDFTTSSVGGGGSHLNVQPSMFLTVYIKL